jgi:hypothetical protein
VDHGTPARDPAEDASDDEQGSVPETTASTTDGTFGGTSRDAGGVSMNDTQARGELLVGHACSNDSQCESGACVATWSLAASQGVCCEVECDGAQKCGASGGCQDCEPGTVESCWFTDVGEPLPGSAEELKGDCHEGERTCSSEGIWNACVGAVGPSDKDFCERAGADENCDGTPNDGCSCVNNETRACGTDIGNCVAGVQTCSDGVWSTCTGEVAREARDSCETDDDDADCDGIPNEGCECIGAASQRCGSCGVQECNPEARKWGQCARLEMQSRCRGASSTILETCDEQGEWVVSTCPFLCQDGECVGECAPGSSRCLEDPERRQTCNGGDWDTIETCATGSQCVNDGSECRRSNGGRCSDDADCASEHCVDDVCCDTECAPVSCIGFDNQCLSHPATSNSNLCDASGQCRDAKEVCANIALPAAAGTSCTFPALPGGECDGVGNCTAPTVVCGNQTCSLDREVCCERNFKGEEPYMECAPLDDCNVNEVPEASGPDRALACDEAQDCSQSEVCGYLGSTRTNKVGCISMDNCPITTPAAAVCYVVCDSPATQVSGCDEGYSCVESTSLNWEDWWFCRPE